MLCYADDRRYSIVATHKPPKIESDDEDSQDEEGKSKAEKTEHTEHTEKEEKKECTYSILGLYEFRSGRKGKTKLVKMRNPWGTEVWDGDWSVNSPLWTKDKLHECDADNMIEDLIFFMPLDAFMEKF